MNTVGTVYGQALYSLAKDESLSDSILQELTILEESFQQTPDFLRLLAAPNLAVAERCEILDTCFRGKVQPYVLNFLKLLTEKNVIRHFGACCKSFREQYYVDHNILPVTAVTAIPLSQEQTNRLTDKLSALTGKTAQINNHVDPECIGGVLLDYDGTRVDGSVANRLDSIRKLLKNTVL